MRTAYRVQGGDVGGMLAGEAGMNETTGPYHIPSLDRLRDLQAQHLVSVRDMDDLIICNYTDRCQFHQSWDEDTTMCRGLILRVDNNWPWSDRITEVVSLPFSKFFNVGEGGRMPTGEIVSVTEKVDGSLGVLYRHEGSYRIATRGSFESEQAEWATEHLIRYSLKSLPQELTLLFEIVYPDGRIVVDYGSREDLVLLGARNRASGVDYAWPFVASLAQEYGFNTPAVYDMQELDMVLELAKVLGPNAEGYVLRFYDGRRFKVKGDAYRTIARLVSHISQKHVIEAMQTGTLDGWIQGLPTEFQDEVVGWRDDTQRMIDSVLADIRSLFEAAPKHSRKDFATWVNARRPAYAPLLFNLLDKRDPMPGIYRMLLTRAIE